MAKTGLAYGDAQAIAQTTSALCARQALGHGAAEFARCRLMTTATLAESEKSESTYED